MEESKRLSEPGVEVENKVSYSSILDELDVGLGQREKRKQLLQDIAKKEFNNDAEPNGVIAHISRYALSSVEIPVLGNILLNIGDVKTLNLILHSP